MIVALIFVYILQNLIVAIYIEWNNLEVYYIKRLYVISEMKPIYKFVFIAIIMLGTSLFGFLYIPDHLYAKRVRKKREYIHSIKDNIHLMRIHKINQIL
jgi:hypothetical protein